VTDIELEQILLAAIESQVGICVSTNDTDLLKKKCYSVRRKAQQSGSNIYDCLTFRTSPVNPTAELWIFNGDLKNGKAETGS
jgi:hypothetical protein